MNNKTNPYFSIVVPTYNRGDFILSALESVEKQNYKNWECIVIDDGSKDNTKLIVQKWIMDKPRFKYYYQKNQERSVARNNGIKKAIGRYITFLDSDDIFTENRLGSIHTFLKGFEHDVIFTGIKFKNGSILNEIKYANPIDNLLNYLAENVIGIPQVTIKREIFNEFPFKPEITNGEDFELWVRISQKYNFIYQKNNASYIAREHSERSVNLISANSAKLQLKTLKYIFNKNHPGYLISNKLKRQKLSNCYFNMAKHFMYNNKKLKSIYFIIKSVITQYNNRLTRHKFFCLSKLLKGRIPKEYKYDI